jgi:hypothetical protein
MEDATGAVAAEGDVTPIERMERVSHALPTEAALRDRARWMTPRLDRKTRLTE